uniref:Uncharacterized protein n=1 Tax=Plectus sambesii TaxID=2011161 RepID=A0A914X7Q6_9BILA
MRFHSWEGHEIQSLRDEAEGHSLAVGRLGLQRRLGLVHAVRSAAARLYPHGFEPEPTRLLLSQHLRSAQSGRAWSWSSIAIVVICSDPWSSMKCYDSLLSDDGL